MFFHPVNQFLWSKNLFPLFELQIYFVKSLPPLHRTKSFQLPSGESFLLWLSSSVVFSKQNPWNTAMKLGNFCRAIQSTCQKYGTDIPRTWYRKFAFSSCLQALENGMDFNFIRKISLQDRNGFVNPDGLYHLQEEKKKYSVKKTISHVCIAVGGDPLSLWCWGAEIHTSSTSGPTHGEPIWNWGAVGASSSFVFPGRFPEKPNKWDQFAFKHQSWSDEMHKFSHAWP